MSKSVLNLQKLLKNIREEFPSAKDKTILRFAMDVSIYAFAMICFPRTLTHSTPDVHHEVYEILEDDACKYSAMALPRGFAKSSMCSYLFPIWKCVRKRADEDLFIVIISESQSQSINFLSRIKSTLTGNPKIMEYYGDFGVNTAKRWQEADIVLKNNARIVAMGTGQKVRGLIQDDTRPNIIIVDDFESETNAMTPEARQRNRKWMMEAVIPSMSQINGRLIMIGTTISEDCFLQWVKDNPHWKVIWKAIVDDEGNPEWEDIYPLSRIERIKEDFEHMGNLSGFFQEYMNQPQSPDDAPFKPEYMKTYSNEIVEESNAWYIRHGEELRRLTVFMGVDLASALGARNDYTVLATVGLDAYGNCFLLDMVRSKSNPAFHADMIINAYKKWHHQGVFIESIAYQESCRAIVRQKCQEEGIHIPGLERKITHRTSKSERLMSLVPIFAQGKFYFRTTDFEIQREFLSFPRGKNDDALDGIHLAVTNGYRPNRKAVEITDTKKKKSILDWMVA